MASPVLMSVMDSPLHPVFTSLYQRRGFEEVCYPSQRKAINALKKIVPDIVVGVFEYGYGNNYAGVNVSNLDVLLYSMQKYAPEAKIIVMATRNEMQHVEKLHEIFSLHAVVQLPVSESLMEKVLDSL